MKSLTKLILPELEQRWALETDLGTAKFDASINQRVAYDELLLEQISAGDKGPTIRIWRNRQCLVATVKESHKPEFDAACIASELEGWPVAVRRTGGTCVPHGHGVLNLTLVYPRPSGLEWSTEDSYRLLCSILQKLLETYGLEVETGEVQGSFCDGKFNLQVANRKLVGTSQRWKGNPELPGSIILSHACLLVDLDLLEATARINQLYQLCGNKQQFDPDACCTLRECLAKSGEPVSKDLVSQVTERLCNIVMEHFPSVDSPLH